MISLFGYLKYRLPQCEKYYKRNRKRLYLRVVACGGNKPRCYENILDNRLCGVKGWSKQGKTAYDYAVKYKRTL